MFSVTINGSAFSIDTTDPACWVTPSTTLNDFLRHHTPFHGTKVACDEGGCGACTVALTYNNATTGTSVTRGINSCLAPLLSLNGLSVTTNDGTGDATRQELHKRLADDYGTQCGYCSSGMIMAMYSLLQENPSPTTLQIEQMLDGNLCRCTGYRPILTAFKKFGTDATTGLPGHTCNKEKCCKKLGGRPIEIEDAARMLKLAPKPIPAPQLGAPQILTVKKVSTKTAATTAHWVEVDTEAKLQYWMNHYTGMKIMLVVGATTQALDRIDYDVYLSVHRIPSFTTITQNAAGVTFGAAVTVTDLKDFLESCTPSVTGGNAHFPQVCAHLHRVASTLIRNRGAVVGNLVYTHRHQTVGQAFPSDAFITMMGIGATITLYDLTKTASTTYSMTDFLKTDLSNKYVQSVTIPWAQPNEVYKSYKIAIRQTLDHALVNGAMRAIVDPTTNKIVGTPTIAIGGVFPAPTRLTAIETAMSGLDITSTTNMGTLVTAVATAVSGTNVDPTGGRVAYRQSVAVNYFYKFLLALQPTLSSDLQAAADVWMMRDVSSGSQTFPAAVPGELPVSQAIAKVDGINQVNGTAQYTADIPAPYGTLYAAVVLTDRANVNIVSVDTSAATAVPGFSQYIDATYFAANPLQNICMGMAIFASSLVSYAGQFIGVVLAESESIARHCASLIEAGVTYSAPLGPVITTLAQAKTGKPAMTWPPITRTTANSPKATTTVTGTVSMGSQFHFHLENHATLVQLVEGQLVVDIACQGPTLIQGALAGATGLPQSDILVRTRRCGGGYGGKIVNPALTGCVTAIASIASGRNVRLDLPFKDAMRSLGCRPLYDADYTMGVTAAGLITSLDININNSMGTVPIDAYECQTTQINIDNCYYIPNFNCTAKSYFTHVAPSTAMRGPGWIQGIAMSEMIMNDAAAQLNVDPITFKSANFYVSGQTTPGGTYIRGTEISTLWTQMYPKYQALQQAAATFNKANKFVKQGVAINPTRFGVSWGGPFNCFVAIHPDGSLSISHGGTEIGQGINTKVAQAAAMVLGLTLDDVQKRIKVQPNTTAISPNPGNVTGGSITSEMCSMGVMRACEVLRDRLSPFLNDNTPFASAVSAALAAGVDLTATGFARAQRVAAPSQSRYNSWGCAAALVEVDTLTGQFEIKQQELLFDCGISLNPYIDIGQIEGGYMIGVGWFTSEEAKWNATTGNCDIAGSWHYKPPGAYDVPEVLNVELLANSNNSVGVLNSKAVGEPPLALAISVVQALENAINAVRSDNGLGQWTATSIPLTVDKIQAACSVTSTNYVLK
jgi:xanthine dehydrogenase/oxidase